MADRFMDQPGPRHRSEPNHANVKGSISGYLNIQVLAALANPKVVN